VRVLVWSCGRPCVPAPTAHVARVAWVTVGSCDGRVLKRQEDARAGSGTAAQLRSMVSDAPALRYNERNNPGCGDWCGAGPVVRAGTNLNLQQGTNRGAERVELEPRHRRRRPRPDPTSPAGRSDRAIHARVVRVSSATTRPRMEPSAAFHPSL